MPTTSINIQECKVTECERHNTRHKELDYVFADRSHLNQSWASPELVERGSLAQYYEWLKSLIKEKTGRAMQKKATPIMEGVVVISDTTTMQQLRDLAKAFEDAFGIRCLRIDMHLDEGWQHSKQLEGDEERKYNLHAHMVFDYIDHNTGKSIKMRTKKKYNGKEYLNSGVLMQDLCAAILHMERGKQSDKKHLNAVEYKVEQETKRAEQTAQVNVKLDQERIEKKKALDEENGSAIRRKGKEIATSVADTAKGLAQRAMGNTEARKLAKENKRLQTAYNALQSTFGEEVENKTAALRDALTAEKKSHEKDNEELEELRKYKGENEQRTKNKNIMEKIVDLIKAVAVELANSFLPENVPGNEFVENKLHDLYRNYWNYGRQGRPLNLDEKYHDFQVKMLSEDVKDACLRDAFKGNLYPKLHEAYKWVDKVTEGHLAQLHEQKQRRAELIKDLCRKYGIDGIEDTKKLVENGSIIYSGKLSHGAWSANADNAKISVFEDDLLVDGYKAAVWIAKNERKQAQEQKQNIDEEERRGIRR